MDEQSYQDLDGKLKKANALRKQMAVAGEYIEKMESLQYKNDAAPYIFFAGQGKYIEFDGQAEALFMSALYLQVEQWSKEYKAL